MVQLNENLEELYRQGWRLIKTGDFPAAFSKFDEALGRPYSFGVKIPLTNFKIFEGIWLNTSHKQFSAICRGASYCKIRMAGKMNEIDWEQVDDAIRFAELQRSVETIELLQLSREIPGWGSTSELIQKEKFIARELEFYKRQIGKLQKTEKKDKNTLHRLDTLLDEKDRLVNELQDFKRKVYLEWLSHQDKSNRHSPLEEYDPLQKLHDVLLSDRTCNLGMMYYMRNPETNELIIIGKVLSSETKLLWPNPSKADFVERKIFIEEDYFNYLIKLYAESIETQSLFTLQNIISTLENYLLPKNLLPVDYLLIIPDAGLEWIPWELLGLKHDKPLGIKYALTRAPSLEFFRICIERRSRTESEQQLLQNNSPQVTLFGIPMDDLKNAEAEVNEIGIFLMQESIDMDMIVGSAATIERFEEIDPNTDVIHFAGHANFHPEDPMLSSLQFCYDKLYPRVIATKQFLHSPVTILNACVSGGTKISGGEILGLIRGFVMAGSFSIIATNWRIDDLSPRILIQKFYEELIEGKSAGLALRNARKYVFNLPEFNQNPLFWTSHSLYGDPFRCLISDSEENKEYAIWNLIDSIGSPDETLSWKVANSLEDIIQQDPALLKKVLVDGLVEAYDDFDAQLVLRRLVAFANQRIINKRFLVNVLKTAYDEIEHEINEDLIRDALEGLKGNEFTPTDSLSDYDPMMKTILPDYQMINDQAGYIFANNDERTERISKALDSNISQMKRAAARILVGIIEFDSDYARYSDFCRIVKKAITSEDKVVRELVLNAIIDSACGVPEEEIIEVLKDLHSYPGDSVRFDAIKALDSAVQESARLEYEEILEQIVYILDKYTRDKNPKISKTAIYSLTEAYEAVEEYELNNILKIIDEILSKQG